MTPKNPAAVALGRKGGKATAEKRTAEERSEAARKASSKRAGRKRKSWSEEITIGSQGTAKKDRLAAAAVVRTKKARAKKEKL